MLLTLRVERNEMRPTLMSIGHLGDEKKPIKLIVRSLQLPRVCTCKSKKAKKKKLSRVPASALTSHFPLFFAETVDERCIYSVGNFYSAMKKCQAVGSRNSAYKRG